MQLSFQIVTAKVIIHSHDFTVAPGYGGKGHNFKVIRYSPRNGFPISGQLNLGPRFPGCHEPVA